MSLEVLRSRTNYNAKQYGLVHILQFSDYVKVGASTLDEPKPKRESQLIARLSKYKLALMTTSCRLESLPAVVLCPTPAQALILEGFLHRFMRYYYPQMLVHHTATGAGTCELYKVEALGILLNQLHHYSQRPTSAIQKWKNWFDGDEGPDASQDLPESLDL
ncbi:H-RAS [Symbiodinium sp. CCMP2592]|nr:H-RAS [Symbiodinium sp. CCMP2592]